MMSFLVHGVSLALVSTALMLGGVAESGPTVSVSGGSIRGRLLPNGGGAVFRGRLRSLRWASCASANRNL